MALLPKTHEDVALAPVAVSIDRNLQRLRDKTLDEIEYELQLELDRPLLEGTRDERAEHVRRLALRGVELHGWKAEVTDDGARLRLTGGSVSLDIALSASLMSYIASGVPAPA